MLIGGLSIDAGVHPRSAPPPGGFAVGRDEELRRIRAAHADLAVAILCGVAGVGKSTLAQRYAASWSGPVAYVRARAGLTIAELSDDVHRTLSVARHDVALDDGERLSELWAVIERFGCLAVIDDLHRLPDPVQRAIVDTASRALRRGRVLAASRERVAVSADGPDRLQLRLEPLDRASALLLWDRLVELYGPGPDFETAWQRSRGNPFLLRQVHVGTLAEHHPLEATLGELSADERRLANAFAVARRPLPRDLIAQLPSGDAPRALATLVARMIVDLSPGGDYQMHDLWRELAIATAGPDALRAASADLVAALPGSSLDTAARVQETAWHLRVLGRHAEIGPLLVVHSTELVRRGAYGVLLRELDELPASALTTELQLLRARTLAHGMQIRRAYRELCSLVDAGHRAPQVRFWLASSATMIGELDHADRLLRELAGDAALPPGARRMARLGLAWNFANRGAMAEARRLLDELAVTTARSRSRSLPLQMFMLGLEGEHARGSDVAAEWLSWLRGNPDDRWSRQITPVLGTVVLAAAGRFDEAEEIVQRMASCLHAPAESLELCWTRMMIRFERGERAAPLAHFRHALHVIDRAGHHVGAMWTRAVITRILFLLGRRGEALAALAEVQAICDRLAMSAYDRIIAVAVADDPLAPGWLARVAAVPDGKSGDATRARAMAVVRLAITGAALEELPPVAVPETDDYGLDRALLALAHAVAAHQRGQLRLQSQHLRAAAAHAAAAGADADLVPRLHELLLDGPASGTCAGDPPGEQRVVIDGTRHEIRVGKRRIALAARPAARQLLYAFATAPAHHLTRDMIARALWGAAYDPLRHDSTIKSSIRRFRALLAGVAEVQTSDGGYHLRLPEGAIVIPPAAISCPGDQNGHQN